MLRSNIRPECYADYTTGISAVDAKANLVRNGGGCLYKGDTEEEFSMEYPPDKKPTNRQIAEAMGQMRGRCARCELDKFSLIPNFTIISTDTLPTDN